MDLTSLARFHIAPGCDPSQPDTWIWTDRSDDVNHTGTGSAVTTTGDRADEISEITPGSCLLQVNNAGGHYCTQNPLGRWYGLLARNCPARWGTISGAEAFTANTTNGWGTPDVGTSWTLGGSASTWSSSGGVGQLSESTVNAFRTAILAGADARNGDATFVAAVPAIATGASLVIGLVARRTLGVNQVWFCIDFGLTGVLGVRIKRDVNGTTTDLGTGTAGTYTANQRIKARCVWDGQDLRMRIWPESGSEPTTWTAVATDSQCAGSAVGFQFWRVGGNTNTSPLVYSVDNLEVEAVEIVGTIPAFPVRWDTTATLSWAPLEIAGITRRLSQGSKPLRSPMYRLTTGYTNLVGYWPFEDGADADQLTNTVPGGLAGSLTNMQLGADGPPGSAGAATFTNSDGTSKVQGSFKGASSTAGWQISWSTQLPALPASKLQMLTWYTSNGYRWTINPDVGVYNLAIIDPNDIVVVNTNIGNVGIGDPNQWVTFRMKATISGGTVSWAFAWFVQGAAVLWGSSGTFSAGSLGALRSWAAAGNASMGGAQICQVFGLTTANDSLLSFAATRAFDGYVNELAADRIARLCAEQDVAVTVEPGDSEPLGAQPLGDLLTLLRDAEAADLGVLYESGAGLGYRPRGARYNRPVAMTLAFTGSRDIGDAPEPTDDDQRVRNEWTVQRTGGSEAIYDDPAHIALNGYYPDSVTINNAFDARLIQIAAWRVHLGTWGEMRWPQIVISLTSQSDLLTAWRGRPFGARIVITGVPSQGPVGADVDLIVEGWRQDITSHTWVLTLNCSPARPWDVAVWGSTPYDSLSTTTNGTLPTGTIGQTGVSLPISTVNPKEVWSTTAVPYDWLVGGERLTVTAMTAAAGSGPYTQTATVTRGVNNLVRAHATGEDVHLIAARPWAL